MTQEAEQLRFPELVDIKTVARLLAVGERYVRRMVAEDQIAIVKIGHYVRIDLEVLRAWIDKRRRSGKARDRDTRRPAHGPSWRAEIDPRDVG